MYDARRGYASYCTTHQSGQGGEYVEQNRQRQPRRSLRFSKNQRYRFGGQRNFDQEVGAFDRINEYERDLNTDYEIGGLVDDVDTGLNADYEVGDMGGPYTFPAGAERRKKAQAQRTQRRNTDR